MERPVTVGVVAVTFLFLAVAWPTGATDEPDELVRGRKVAITVKSGVVKKLTFIAKTPTSFDLPDRATIRP
jgi:hypothetical protein